MATMEELLANYAAQTAAMSKQTDRLRLWLDQRLALETGTEVGGPNGDGTYPITGPDGVIRMIKSQARVALDLMNIPIVTLVGANTQTLDLVAHKNRFIRISNGSSIITVNLPVAAPVGWSCMLFGVTGPLALRVPGGPAIKSDQSFTRTRAMNSVATCIVESRPNNLASYAVTGSMVTE